MNSQERRQHRSKHRGEALSLLLSSCRARGDLSAIVIADSVGLLVASSAGPGFDPAELAAYAAARPGGALRAKMKVFRFLSEGDAYYLAFVGAPPKNDEAWLTDALDGSRRILAA